MNGRSTKSFLAEGRLDALSKELNKGDYLFIQFGHNDQKKDSERGTDPFTDYVENLAVFAQAAEKAGAIPVFLTSVTRRKYLPNSKLDPQAVGHYPEAMRTFAEKNQFPLLDVFQYSQEMLRLQTPEETKKLYLHLSPGESQNYPEGLCDNTHFSPEGAYFTAHLITDLIKKTNLPLTSYLKGENK
ncbi:rhamnogalacturonan acetylesterase RhgT family protein [Enterococcus faecalis 13-SD-W-01]|nr:rhamnogalacturonan acetylesterase RhgT family protein [Enterococcus faecalis 13-SD-W-01]